MAKVGVSNLHYAVMDSAHEDSATANPTYGTIKNSGCGVVNADVQVATNTAKLYADNILFAQETSMAEVTVSLELATLPASVVADLLGHTYDSTNKTLISKATDSAPFVAIAFEMLTTEGKMAVWLYKGKFQENSITANTKGESTQYQTEQITGTFQALKGAGDNAGRWKYSQDFGASDSTASFYASVPLATVSP